jgi:nucleoside-diphosphate-sugar epimerase
MTLLTPEVARRVGNLFIILGDGTYELPLVYVDDVVNAIVLAAEKGKFDGSVFHIVDRAHITQNQLVQDYILKNAENAKVVHLPVAILYILAAGLEVLSKLLKRPPPLSIYRVKSAMARMRFECSRAERGIGWQPLVGIASGLQETMAAARANYCLNGLKPVQERLAAK